jgi:hypothetical protein
VSSPALDKSQLARLISSHIAGQLYDESGLTVRGTAIYYLSDPREIREVRYVGQTKDPKRRFAQHLNTARLWLTDERPWWVKSPKLRPLSEWIRQLYQDERRLPTMIVTQWVENGAQARLAERAGICACLQNHQRVLNVETEFLGQQFLLL